MTLAAEQGQISMGWRTGCPRRRCQFCQRGVTGQHIERSQPLRKGIIKQFFFEFFLNVQLRAAEKEHEDVLTEAPPQLKSTMLNDDVTTTSAAPTADMHMEAHGELHVARTSCRGSMRAYCVRTRCVREVSQ